MGILTRFKDIMSANINALLDKCEDPAKMIDEYMRQVTEQLAEVKEEAVRRHQSAIEQIEKRHKGHVADLLKAIKGDDQKVVVQTLLEQNEAKSRDSMATYQKQMNELKQAQTDKILSLTRMYEDKLKLAQRRISADKESRGKQEQRRRQLP